MTRTREVRVSETLKGIADVNNLGLSQQFFSHVGMGLPGLNQH